MSTLINSNSVQEKLTYLNSPYNIATLNAKYFANKFLELRIR